ncbi:MAG: HD domain-containing protein [Spirochaetes bacterium]|nr:HD domain-containing protein [Spirochaetota bacterium]
MQKTVISVIDIGSSSIKMNIYELFEDHYTILESLRQHVRLGNDSFYQGKISRKTINECIIILNRYKKLCKDYNTKYIKTVATTAVREAVNVDVFIDSIFRHTDLEIELLGVQKESEYIYNAIMNIIYKKKINYNNENWAIVEIGAGNVEITLLDGDCILYSRSLPLGILKIMQIYKKMFEYSEENLLNFYTILITNELKNFKRNMPLIKINKLYAVGTELSLLPSIIKSSGAELPLITKLNFKKFFLKIKDCTEEQLFHKIKMPHDLTESFIPALHLFNKILDFFKCDNFIIPKISLTDGIINYVYYVQEEKDYFKKLEKQLKINAINIGKSLKFDEKHAVKVTDIAVKLFNETKEIHRLGELEKCYLIVASLLHDIGSSISYRSHHKHSLYIIKALNFFSLNTNQINIIANIARYHRKSSPKNSHADYTQLSLYDRMIVLKLSSILRIADSLDNTHLQQIDDIKIEIEGTNLLIIANVKDNYLSEFFSFEYKKELFEDIFGYHLNIKKVIK